MEVCCRLDLESGDISISSSVRSRGKLHGIDGGGMMKLPKSPSILLNGKGGSRGFTSGEGLLAGVPRWLSLAKTTKHLCIFKTYGIIKKTFSVKIDFGTVFKHFDHSQKTCRT